MNYQEIVKAILTHIDKDPLDHGAYTDLLSAARQWEGENFQAAHEVNGQLRELATKALRVCPADEADFFYGAYKKSLLFDAPHFFDSFLLYLVR